MSQKRILTVLVVLLIALSIAVPALADSAGAVAWLRTQQNADGGFGSPQSTVGATADAILAAAASGADALYWNNGGKSANDFLQANIGSVTKAGELGKVLLALTASGKNPRTYTDTDLIKKLEGMIGSDGKIGGESDFINDHCFALLGLKSAYRPTPPAAVTYLLSRQIDDGTWAWNGDTTEGNGDNNTTAMAVVALIAADVSPDNAQIQKAMEHLKGQQNPDGGFPYINPSPYGTDSDANSTSVVIWAILSVGQDPAGAEWKYFAKDGTSALDRLYAFQNDSGAFHWQAATPDDNLASTVQAMIALERKTLPFARYDVDQPVAPTATPAPEAEPEATVSVVGDTEGPEPETLPESGVNLWLPILSLLGSSTALVGIGVKLRKRS